MNASPLGPDLLVRPECADDVDAISRVLAEAFGGDTEATLVGALRKGKAMRISLVACTAGDIVGHVAFSPMHAGGEPDRDDLLGMAPVAVHPKWQRRSIGSELVRRGLDECRKRGVAAVFVLGDPAFYGRFGFVSARTRAFHCRYDAAGDAFQLLLLSDAVALPPAGLICYCREFDSVT